MRRVMLVALTVTLMLLMCSMALAYTVEGGSEEQREAVRQTVESCSVPMWIIEQELGNEVHITIGPHC